MLDSQELLHLGITASQSGDHHQAIKLLHQAIDLDPDNAKAIYMLAAEHAEIGLFDRAIEGIETALSIDPKIEMANFQLGMLYMQAGENNKAKSLFDSLIENSNDKSLLCFSEGLNYLIEENSAKAIESLKKGIAIDTNNMALSQSMSAILKTLEKDQQTSSAQEGKTDANGSSYSEEKPVYLGAYKDRSE